MTSDKDLLGYLYPEDLLKYKVWHFSNIAEIYKISEKMLRGSNYFLGAFTLIFLVS